MGLQPPDYGGSTRSPIFAHWLRSLARYAETAEPLEAQVGGLLSINDDQDQEEEDAAQVRHRERPAWLGGGAGDVRAHLVELQLLLPGRG